MVANTPLGIPYVEDADFPKNYPAVSLDLAETIDDWLDPLVVTNAVTFVPGPTAASSRLIIRRPIEAMLIWTYTANATTNAGDSTFQWGTLASQYLPKMTVSGTFRQNAGGGIVGLNTSGTLSLKWLSSTHNAGHVLNGVIVWELAIPLLLP